jgi:deoxyadenosine/deoxycytidine kinase
VSGVPGAHLGPVTASSSRGLAPSERPSKRALEPAARAVCIAAPDARAPRAVLSAAVAARPPGSGGGRGLPGRPGPAILRADLEFRHLAIDGPPGVGKTALADRLGTRLDAAIVLDETDNPFLADARRGRPGAAFQAQLVFLLARHRQQGALRQGDLFNQTTICDYLFDKDKIYAYLGLDDNELYIYQRLYDLLVRDVPAPDLAIYLQAPAEILWKRLRQRARRDPPLPAPATPDDLREINEAFNHFFFHYDASPLLVVETSQVDPGWPDATIDELLRQIGSMSGGTQFYVPRTS